MLKILKWGVYFIFRLANRFPLITRPIVVVSGGNFGYSAHGKANYEYFKNLAGKNREVVFVNMSGRGFGVAGRSLRGVAYLHFARYIVADNVLPFSISLKRKRVLQTWHGIPIKQLGPTSEGSIERKVEGWLLAYCWKRYSSILSSGPYFTKVIRESFGIDGSNVDESLTPQQLNVLRLRQEIDKQGKLFAFYAPTFRQGSEASRQWDLLNNAEFLRYIEDRMLQVAVKYHPLDKSWAETKARLTGNRWIEFLDSQEDAYAMIMRAEIFISDYSSMFFDAALLERPMLAYCVDMETYARSRGFARQSFYELIPTVRNEKEIVVALESCPIARSERLADVIAAPRTDRKLAAVAKRLGIVE